LDDEQADPVWEIPEEAVETLTRCLIDREDEVVRFYACKTVENITAQSITAGCSFATLKVATLLLNIYHTQSNEVFKISAAVSISHLRLAPRISRQLFWKDQLGYSRHLLR